MSIQVADCDASTSSILAKHCADATAPFLPPLCQYGMPLDFTSLQIRFERVDIYLLT